MVPLPWLLPIVAQHTIANSHLHLQFPMDPSCLPFFISSSRSNPDVISGCFYLAITWNFSFHLASEKMMKLRNLKN
jgi:hypothetical protein